MTPNPVGLVPVALVLAAACLAGSPARGCDPNPPQRLLEAMNDARRERRLAPLVVNDRLVRAARAHALDLSTGEASGHVGSNGSEPIDRVARDEGRSRLAVPFVAVGENIAINVPASDEVVAAWLGSPGHRAVLLHAGYREVGIGFVAGDAGSVWVADFASTGEEPMASPDRCHPWG